MSVDVTYSSVCGSKIPEFSISTSFKGPGDLTWENVCVKVGEEKVHFDVAFDEYDIEEDKYKYVEQVGIGLIQGENRNIICIPYNDCDFLCPVTVDKVKELVSIFSSKFNTFIKYSGRVPSYEYKVDEAPSGTLFSLYGTIEPSEPETTFSESWENGKRITRTTTRQITGSKVRVIAAKEALYILNDKTYGSGKDVEAMNHFHGSFKVLKG